MDRINGLPAIWHKALDAFYYAIRTHFRPSYTSQSFVEPTQVLMSLPVSIRPPQAPGIREYRLMAKFGRSFSTYSQQLPLGSIQSRNTIRLYSSASTNGTRILWRAEVPREYSPSGTGLRAVFKDAFSQYRGVHKAGKLPCQIAWTSIPCYRSEMIQQRYFSNKMSQHALNYFDGTYPSMDTQEADVTSTSSEVVENQEKAVPATVNDVEHDVLDDKKLVDDAEKLTPEDIEEYEATIEVFPGRIIRSTIKNRIFKASAKETNSLQVHFNSSEHMYTTKITTHMECRSGELLDCTVTTGSCKSTETAANERSTEDNYPIASTGFNDTGIQAARTLKNAIEAQDAKLPLVPSVTSSDPQSDTSQTHDGLSPQKRVGPGTKNFLTEVLTPRGILIETSNDEVEPAIEHFKRGERPGEKARKHYTRHEGLRSSTAWIDPSPINIEAIRSNYSEMDQLGANVLCESEWTDDAVRLLLMSEGRERIRPNTGNLPQWLPVRMREECFRQRRDDNWEIPPIIHKGIPVRAAFDFNVQPDCSYWLWTGGFPLDIQGTLQQYASVRFDRALCPYLTIELKKDTKANTTGRQQIAASGAMALYNRWKLRERYLRETRASLRKCQFSDVRHYSLLLTGAQYEVWCLRPEDGAMVGWNGCSMRKVYTGNLITEAGIRDYINWINEIHYWGNITHGSGCVRDIAGCVKVSRKRG